MEEYRGSGPFRPVYALVVLLGAFFGLLVGIVLGGGSGSGLLVWGKLVWLLYLPVALANAAGLLAFSSREDFHLERRSQSDDYHVVFQVVTRGFNREAVHRTVCSVLYWAPRYLHSFEVWVVTEDDVDKGFFERLRRLSDRVRVVYVPRSYRTHQTLLLNQARKWWWSLP